MLSQISMQKCDRCTTYSNVVYFTFSRVRSVDTSLMRHLFFYRLILLGRGRRVRIKPLKPKWYIMKEEKMLDSYG